MSLWQVVASSSSLGGVVVFSPGSPWFGGGVVWLPGPQAVSGCWRRGSQLPALGSDVCLSHAVGPPGQSGKQRPLLPPPPNSLWLQILREFDKEVFGPREDKVCWEPGSLVPSQATRHLRPILGKDEAVCWGRRAPVCHPWVPSPQ